MTDQEHCPNCGSDSSLEYRLIYEERPGWQRILILTASGVFFLGPLLSALLLNSYRLDFYGLLTMVFGAFWLWASLNKSEDFNINRNVTRVDLRCRECDQEWSVQIRKPRWDAAPPDEWREASSARKIPHLPG